MKKDLRRAVARDEFLLHYQPRFDLATGRLHGMEALIRWQHPEMGLLSPDAFIPLAEETGLIVPIDEWVIHTACAQNQAWHMAGFAQIRVSVNLSVRLMQQDTLVQTVQRALDSTGLTPWSLEIEITESNAAEHWAQLKKLSDLGIGFSLDAFGSGRSPLEYVKQFPVRTLRIERSFVRALPHDLSDAAIATAVIALAHTLDLRVVAEGVESAEQCAFMREQRCDEAQGFFFSKPLPVAEFTKQCLTESKIAV